MTKSLGIQTKKSYDEATKQIALVKIAHWNGNTRQAARVLAEEGIEIPRSTLEAWKQRDHPEEYRRIRTEILPKLREGAADRHAAQEERDLTISEAASDLIMARLPTMKDKELIMAKGNADVGSGIHGEKRLLFEGQPTVNVARTSAEIMRELKSMGAEDVIDAVVVEETKA